MDIIVLLKQVPSTEAIVSIAEDGKSINTADVKWVINPYDEFAVEEALRIREAQGGKVTILCVGADKATEAVRTALAMGADEGVLVSDPAIESLDALATARIIQSAIASIPYDLIIAGMRAVDVDDFQVGPAVAEMLGIPSISMVVKQEINDGAIVCHQTIDGGTAVVQASLPVLFTTQRGLNEPRYASLPGIMKAKKKPLAIKTLADIELDAAAVNQVKVTTVAMQPPPERTGGRIIEAESAQQKAAELARLLREEAKVV